MDVEYHINYQSLMFIEVNGTFVEYTYGQSFPTVRVDRVYVAMDPIGFVFLFFFAIVIVIQVNFYFHRYINLFLKTPILTKSKSLFNNALTLIICQHLIYVL